ncbi:MAG: HypC/HybG/HupF family hydrogenase formation chaperone [Planctomycetes bacterium]|nr:HypC/HybG/HupF family hydrogenase formation chaperone [Planctomycetota bacterium]
MCLALPMKLLSRREFDGIAELRGVRRSISLMLEPDALPGDFVLVHAGFAIGTVDAHEARRTLALVDEVLGDRSVLRPPEPDLREREAR